MAAGTQNVRCFQITIFLSTDNPNAGRRYEINAGNNADQTLGGLYHTDMTVTEKEVYMEILYKLVEAVDGGARTIKVVVDGSNTIIRDSGYPLPSLETHIDDALGTKNSKQAALLVIKSVLDKVLEGTPTASGPLAASFAPRAASSSGKAPKGRKRKG